jgi:hypothetical protein
MPLSLDDLESHLFECADIIRDAVDPTDYKEYILPLVYYKSVSDEFKKRHKKNVQKYDEEFARTNDLYDIPVVPEGYMWDDIRSISDNIDKALNEAFSALVDENADLSGVFLADYTDPDALGAFALTFKNITFTDNGTNKAFLGVTTYRNIGNNKIDKQGTGLVFRADLPQFRKVDSGSDNNLPSSVSFNNGGDAVLMFRDGEVAGYHNGYFTGFVSFNEASAAMYPAIQLEDNDSVSDTLEVDDIVVEPLPEVLH